jgi:hypothetical protein
MPKSMVIKVCNNRKLINKLEVKSFGSEHMYNILLAHEVARIFNVSYKAAEVRLCNLNLMHDEDLKQKDNLIEKNITNIFNVI